MDEQQERVDAIARAIGVHYPIGGRAPRVRQRGRPDDDGQWGCACGAFGPVKHGERVTHHHRQHVATALASLTDDLPLQVPTGRPQGGLRSEHGRSAYWRRQWEHAVGALADLIAEHNETLEGERDRIAAAIEEHVERVAQAIEALDGPTTGENSPSDYLALAARIARQEPIE